MGLTTESTDIIEMELSSFLGRNMKINLKKPGKISRYYRLKHQLERKINDQKLVEDVKQYNGSDIINIGDEVMESAFTPLLDKYRPW